MKHHNSSECSTSRRSIQDTLEVLSGKWKLPIIITLMYKPHRFKELVREVGISPRMLSKELLDLEMNLLITRTVLDTRPITVEYAITPYAQSLNNVMQALAEWGRQHRITITSKRTKAIESVDLVNS